MRRPMRLDGLDEVLLDMGLDRSAELRLLNTNSSLEHPCRSCRGAEVQPSAWKCGSARGTRILGYGYKIERIAGVLPCRQGTGIRTDFARMARTPRKCAVGRGFNFRQLHHTKAPPHTGNPSIWRFLPCRIRWCAGNRTGFAPIPEGLTTRSSGAGMSARGWISRRCELPAARLRGRAGYAFLGVDVQAGRESKGISPLSMEPVKSRWATSRAVLTEILQRERYKGCRLPGGLALCQFLCPSETRTVRASCTDRRRTITDESRNHGKLNGKIQRKTHPDHEGDQRNRLGWSPAHRRVGRQGPRDGDD